MRIIAGEFKGRRLAGPTGPGLRPTSDRLRETLFNVLGGRLDGARVLDAFAGTGAVGLEALSRGAATVTMVEADRRALEVLTGNIARCGAEAACRVVRGRFPEALPPGGRPFDVAFLDPPYDSSDLPGVLAAAARFVGPAGRVVLEHSRRTTSPEEAGGLVRTRVLTSGDSALSFYRAPPVEP